MEGDQEQKDMMLEGSKWLLARQSDLPFLGLSPVYKLKKLD
jgi:hypothetical protein